MTFGYEELMVNIPKSTSEELKAVVDIIEKERALYYPSLLKMILKSIRRRVEELEN